MKQIKYLIAILLIMCFSLLLVSCNKTGAQTTSQKYKPLNPQNAATEAKSPKTVITKEPTASDTNGKGMNHITLTFGKDVTMEDAQKLVELSEKERFKITNFEMEVTKSDGSAEYIGISCGDFQTNTAHFLALQDFVKQTGEKNARISQINLYASEEATLKIEQLFHP